MSELETIEGEVQEQVGMALEVHGAAPPPATLFHTDDPVVVVQRATEIADLLTRILREKQLVKQIGNREHVQVEGWTMLGSMLGVYAVTVWTKEIGNGEGWEARVEARTKDGAVVGAAEAECRRAEKEWGPNPTRGKMRDDYALRSMAQTRATSKALRIPLGFIVTMAGFDATPSDEIGEEERVAGNRRPDGRPRAKVPRSWTELEAGVIAVDTEAWPIFQAFVRAASYHLWGQTDYAELHDDQKKVLFQKAASVYTGLVDSDAGDVGAFVVWDIPVQTAAWARVVDGTMLEIPDYVPPAKPSPEELENIAEAERLADDSIKGP